MRLPRELFRFARLFFEFWSVRSERGTSPLFPACPFVKPTSPLPSLRDRVFEEKTLMGKGFRLCAGKHERKTDDGKRSRTERSQQRTKTHASPARGPQRGNERPPRPHTETPPPSDPNGQRPATTHAHTTTEQPLTARSARHTHTTRARTAEHADARARTSRETRRRTTARRRTMDDDEHESPRQMREERREAAQSDNNEHRDAREQEPRRGRSTPQTHERETDRRARRERDDARHARRRKRESSRGRRRQERAPERIKMMRPPVDERPRERDAKRERERESTHERHRRGPQRQPEGRGRGPRETRQNTNKQANPNHARKRRLDKTEQSNSRRVKYDARNNDHLIPLLSVESRTLRQIICRSDHIPFYNEHHFSSSRRLGPGRDGPEEDVLNLPFKDRKDPSGCRSLLPCVIALDVKGSLS
ncbi:hypothetical protein C7M84_024349 [Penaeus vannamei]|uniref:Uncharacterized protein n=1 Tax=Penaeus vannamei TaxID=6689 RepID=A0A423U1F0_PENVA|nr:hypothetical protein C7M84_024349 [Penaeus vannamei]